MDAIEGLLLGFSVALSPTNLLMVFVGVLLGTTIGVLPGLGTVAGAALVLPLTFALEPTAGLMMIAGIYYGAMYGGSVTSILLNVPGEAASVVATFDGYKLSQQGRAGPVLFITTIGSFIAGTLTAVLVTFFAPSLSDVGILFGPSEFFALITASLLVLATVSGGGLLSSLFPLGLGLIIGTIGQEPVSALSRFTFGYVPLSQGVDIVPVAVGAFGVVELMVLAGGGFRAAPIRRLSLAELRPSREELRRSVFPWLRGTAVGSFFGLLPGPSATMSTFTSYRLEKAVSWNRRQLGSGAIEGVAGPEAANNAAATSAVVPILCLGIPFSATLALMLSAMMVQGVQPGPTLILDHPEIFWGVIASIFMGNVMLVLLNLPMIGVWVNALRMPKPFLITVIFLCAVVGCFSVNNSMLDVNLLFFFGLLGYALRKANFNLAPLILGVVLGPFIEKYLLQSLAIGRGEVGYLFVRSPITIVIWSCALAVIVSIAILGAGRARAGSKAVTESETGPLRG